MFFVFASGDPNAGEACGGLGDMMGKAETFAEARDVAARETEDMPWADTVRILDGATGEVSDIIKPPRHPT